MKGRMDNHHYAVIMAGGSGTRLWPLSRKDLPKQMQPFLGDSTLLNETVERLAGIVPIDRIIISTTANLVNKIKRIVPNLPEANFMVEPVARGVAAAFAYLNAAMLRRDQKANLFFLASDHSVTDIKQFQSKVEQVFSYIDSNSDHIAMIGIKPTFANTGLGYIKLGTSIENMTGCYSVEKFVEKPTLKVAQRYFKSQDYLWNTAYYCFRAETLLRAYHDADPILVESAEYYCDNPTVENYSAIPIKSQEIEIIDATKFPLVVLGADFGWNDIGNWQALHEVLATSQGQHVVAKAGRHVDIGSSNCLVYADGDKLIATLGLDNIVVVDTPDALLVLNKDKPQEIKNLLEHLKDNGLHKYL